MDLVTQLTLIQTITSVLGIVLQILQMLSPSVKAKFGEVINFIVTLVIKGLLLSGPNTLFYILAIRLATYDPGTASLLVARSTGWAIVMGTIWGIIWSRFIVPWRIYRRSPKRRIS